MQDRNNSSDIFLKWRWKVRFVGTANVTELYKDSHWNRCRNDWRNTRVRLMTIVSGQWVCRKQ